MRVSGIQAQRDDELSLYRGSMRSAMARFLNVNDFSGSSPVPRRNPDLNLDPETTSAPEFGIAPTGDGIAPSPSGIEPAGYGVAPTGVGVAAARYGVAATDRKNSGDQGPCLYFGPQGQRCDRPAIANGFCARHLPAHVNQSARFGPTSPAQTGVASPSSEPYAAVPSPGFKHYGGLPSPGSKAFARIIAVGIAIFAALWPVIADLLREIVRWIHGH
jgi:hypothetical protein